MATPVDETVIREVTKNVWTFSKPFALFGIFPVGGRSTAIKLQDGDVWVLASTPLGESTKTKLAELGNVKYIVAAGAFHSLYTAEFKKAYPTAKVIGVEPLVEKKRGILEFDGVYGVDAKDAEYGFEQEIKSCYFSGSSNKNMAFLHEPSKTLIQADLLFNLPALEQYSKSNSSGRFPVFGTFGPMQRVHKYFVWNVGKNKEAMRRDAATVAGWDFERIITCHGNVIETGGNAMWRECYKWYLDGTK